MAMEPGARGPLCDNLRTWSHHHLIYVFLTLASERASKACKATQEEVNKQTERATSAAVCRQSPSRVKVALVQTYHPLVSQTVQLPLVLVRMPCSGQTQRSVAPWWYGGARNQCCNVTGSQPEPPQPPATHPPSPPNGDGKSAVSKPLDFSGGSVSQSVVGGQWSDSHATYVLTAHRSPLTHRSPPTPTHSHSPHLTFVCVLDLYIYIRESTF